MLNSDDIHLYETAKEIGITFSPGISAKVLIDAIKQIDEQREA